MGAGSLSLVSAAEQIGLGELVSDMAARDCEWEISQGTIGNCITCNPASGMPQSSRPRKRGVSLIRYRILAVGEC